LNSIGESNPINSVFNYKHDESNINNVQAAIKIINKIGYNRPDDYKGIVKSAKEDIAEVDEILTRLSLPKIINNDAFIWLLDNNYIDIANLLYDENRINISTINQYRLFLYMAKLNDINLLKKILQNPLTKFNAVDVLKGPPMGL
jgi:hypothetical protein